MNTAEYVVLVMINFPRYNENLIKNFLRVVWKHLGPKNIIHGPAFRHGTLYPICFNKNRTFSYIFNTKMSSAYIWILLFVIFDVHSIKSKLIGVHQILLRFLLFVIICLLIQLVNVFLFHLILSLNSFYVKWSMLLNVPDYVLCILAICFHFTFLLDILVF